MYCFGLITNLLNPREHDHYFKNPKILSLRINDQQSNINNRSTNRLVFKHQELIIKFLELFWIFTNFI